MCISKYNSSFNFKVIGYSEIDKFASELFDCNHKNNKGGNIKNFGDITTFRDIIDEIPDFDMFTGGFPCQPFSTAGMQKGEEDPYGRGTLFYHIIELCKVKQPKYILMENVKGLTSKKFQPTFERMKSLLTSIGYGEDPLAYAILNSKDYGIPQNRERLWMFARLGGLPKNFSIVPPKSPNDLLLKDFLDTEPDKYLYLSKEQIDHLKLKHNIPSFKVKESLCFDVYNKKIKTDGYCITITQPEHNSLRIIEAAGEKEIVRKMSVSEQFRLMGFKDGEINFCNQSYTQLSKRAGNGWDINLATILIKHIFEQL